MVKHNLQKSANLSSETIEIDMTATEGNEKVLIDDLLDVKRVIHLESIHPTRYSNLQNIFVLLFVIQDKKALPISQ